MRGRVGWGGTGGGGTGAPSMLAPHPKWLLRVMMVEIGSLTSSRGPWPSGCVCVCRGGNFPFHGGAQCPRVAPQLAGPVGEGGGGIKERRKWGKYEDTFH